MFALRLRSLYVLIALVALLLTARLAQLQFGRGAEFRRLALVDGGRSVLLPALRGRILDRDGVVLAADRCGYELHVVPSRYRRRSLLHALRDLTVLLDAHPDDSIGAVDRLESIVVDPEPTIRRLMALPVANLLVDAAVLDARSKKLETFGWSLVVRELGGLEPRILEALGVARGDGAALSAKDRDALLAADGTLGTALPMDAESLVRRLGAELTFLRRIGGETGTDDVFRLIATLESLLERERKWVDSHLDRELRDAICLDHLGSGELLPGELGPRSFLELVRRVAVPVDDAARAHRWLEDTSSILGGSLPVPREISQSGSPGVDLDSDSVQRARAEGFFECNSEKVAEAFARQILAEEGGDGERYLTSYRRRRVDRRLIGGRGFVLARGLSPWVAGRVEGTAGQGESGFSVEPMFVRDAVLPSDVPSLGLLIGVVNTSGTPLSGLERMETGTLAGIPGRATLDREGNEIARQSAQHGRDVETTLSLALQRRLEGVLGERAGAVAVVDARDGAVLALVTNPAAPVSDLADAVALRYELERERVRLTREVRRGADEAALDLLHTTRTDLAANDAYHRALENPRFTPPGSIFKPISLLAGFEAGVVHAHTVHTCGVARGTKYRCRNHGTMDVVATLQRSCNTFCYETGLALGVPAMVTYLDRLGYFDPVPGLMTSAGAQRDILFRETDARSMSIGQGSLDCAPVRAAGLMACIARGRVVHPHAVLPEGFQPVGEPIASDSALGLIREGMARVVQPRGSAGAVRRLRELDVAGKTGTADFKEDAVNQAWFAGYAPRSAPTIAFAVMLERTELHGADAAEVSAEVVARCFEVVAR